MTITNTLVDTRAALLAWCLCLLVSCLAMSSHAVTISASTSSLSLNHHVSYYIDEQNQLEIQDIVSKEYPFLEHSGGALNFGHTDASIWVRMPLHLADGTEHADTWLIELGFSGLNRANLYIQRSDGQLETHRSGFIVPVSEQFYPHHNFVFPVKLSPGENVMLYFNVQRKGGAVQVPLHLWNRWSILMDEAKNNYAFGAYFGVMYVMILYNFFIFVTLRQPSQFYYDAHLTASVAAFQALTGYGHLLLWPESPEMNGFISIVCSSLGIALALQFLRTFVHSKHISPNLDKMLILFISIGPCIALGQILFGHLFSVETSIYAVVASIVAIVTALICWRKGSRQAGFFLVAWMCLLAGIGAYALTLLGILPVTFYTKNGMMIGATIEVILLSLGLADRFNAERKERYLALAERHDALVKLKEIESRLMFRALHSSTTGLPNRNLLRECLNQLIEKRQVETHFSLLLVNFKNFHEFNKTLGHQNGDAILRLLAERLGERIAACEYAHPIENAEARQFYIATIEGVTFGAVLLDVDNSPAKDFALSLVEALEQPFSYQGMSLQMDACVGVSQYPHHGNTADHLLRSAQIALELAGNHPEQVTVYNPDEDLYSAKRLTLLSDLRHAIEQDKLELYLQPQLDLSGSRVTGAEVLIRWKHPQHGFIPPDQFIPLAERTGVIQPLTYWVFNKAFSLLQQLNQLGHNLTLSVNISARNLQDPAFQEKVLIAAKAHHISPSQVVMELTETAVMLNENSGARILYQLDSAGFGIAIDDFGTGYSSLAYLKRLPVQEIKIDRAFIKDMAQQIDDQVIVTTTLQMGHNLGLRVVAEGIEDEITLNFLRKAGCDLAQGYFIARPMPYADFVIWLNLRDERGVSHAAAQKAT